MITTPGDLYRHRAFACVKDILGSGLINISLQIRDEIPNHRYVDKEAENVTQKTQHKCRAKG